MLKPSRIFAALCIACFSLASHAETVVIGDFDDGTMQGWIYQGNGGFSVSTDTFTGSGFLLEIVRTTGSLEWSLLLNSSANPDLFLLNNSEGPQIVEFDVYWDPPNDWVGGDGSMAWSSIVYIYEGGGNLISCSPSCVPPNGSTTTSGASEGTVSWDFIANGTPLGIVPSAWASLMIATESRSNDPLDPISEGRYYIDNIRITVPPSPPVFTPVSVVTTSEWDGDPPHAKKENLINGSGLSVAGPVWNLTHDDESQATSMWHAGQQDGGLGGPTGAPPVVAAQAIVFDLGSWEDLSGVYIWNHNQAGLTLRGVDQFEVLVSSDTDPLAATFASVGTFNLDEASGGPTEPTQFVPFSATAVRLVRFDINSAHSGVASGLTNDWVGLSEVRFVPEPGLPLQLAIGAGTLLLLARWRRRPSHGRAFSDNPEPIAGPIRAGAPHHRTRLHGCSV